jgi:hypothetical protein
MSLAHGTLGATAGALIGATVWTAISYLTGWNLGILAPIVGGCAGFGMGMGNKGKGGVEAGVLAATLTVLAVLGSRYALSQMEYADFNAEMAEVTEEDARDRLAWEIMDRYLEDGVELSEPEDDESYPPEVEAKLAIVWGGMDEVERHDFMKAMSQESLAFGEEHAEVGTFIFFLLNMGLFGWVFMVLAACTAYKTASTAVATVTTVDVIEPGKPRAAAMPAAPAAPAAPKPQPESDGGGSYFARLGQAEQRDPLEHKRSPAPTDRQEAA